jgi:DNA-directed RNA polymerase specialized sigma24 family protein
MRKDAVEEATIYLSRHLVQHVSRDPRSGRTSLTVPANELQAVIWTYANNSARNERRKLRRSHSLHDRFHDHVRARGSATAPPADLPTPEDAEIQLLAIDGLPAKVRRVAALYLVSNLAANEIAAALDLPIEEVQGLIAAAQTLVK